MAVKERTDCEEMEWSAEEEIQLFKALGGLKPIGINKHFYMACICERLSTALKREITPDVVWAHLKTMYNLDILDQLEPVPFPQDQCDFQLPDAEFSALMSKKLADVENGGGGGGEGSSSGTAVVVAGAIEMADDEISDAAAPKCKKNPIEFRIIIRKSRLKTIARTATPQPLSGSSTSSSSTKNATALSRSSSASKSNSQTLAIPAAAATTSTASSTPTASATVSGTSTPTNAGTLTSAPPPASGSAAAAAATAASTKSSAQRDLERKIAGKLSALEQPKRTPKRTRGSMSIESNSPSTTPPPTHQTKRRRF